MERDLEQQVPYGAMFGIFLAQKLNKKPFTIVGMEIKKEILLM